MSVLNNSGLERLAARLHDRSDQQIPEMSSHYRQRAQRTPRSAQEEAAESKRFMSDKLVALDRDKAEFCYQLIRATDARRIVEIGTSHGVSTLYLAAALGDNIRHGGGDGMVFGTEHEPDKVRSAQAHLAEAGLSHLATVLAGDLRQTLTTLDGPVDFMLIDIWIPMARPALELALPLLRPGAGVVCDNTQAYREAYAEYFAFLADPAHGFRTMTLPFSGGLEMSVLGP